MINSGKVSFLFTHGPAAWAIVQKFALGVFTNTKLHLINEYYWCALIDKKFRRTTDFIHDYLILHLTNGTEIWFVI